MSHNMDIKSENLSTGDLLKLRTDKKQKENNTFDWFKSYYKDIDLEQHFVYMNLDCRHDGREIAKISYCDPHKKILNNNFFLDDFEQYLPPQDNEFVKMMSSNERMLDLPI